MTGWRTMDSFEDSRAKADDDADAGPMEAPGDTEDRPVQTANAESVSRPVGGRAPAATSERMDETGRRDGHFCQPESSP